MENIQEKHILLSIDQLDWKYKKNQQATNKLYKYVILATLIYKIWVNILIYYF